MSDRVHPVCDLCEKRHPLFSPSCSGSKGESIPIYGSPEWKKKMDEFFSDDQK